MAKTLPPLPNGAPAQAPMGQPMVTGNEAVPSTNGDPMRFMELVMDNEKVDLRLRFEAGKALLPYKYPKLGEEGKKSKQKSAAESVGGGRFRTRGAPLPH